jgi:signal transduction histidine kinase
VVSNLLENELTHLPENSRALVTLRGFDRGAELIVEDTGPGFPPEIADRLFERFVKGKNSPGHGLGLAFVEAVVKAHGGSVRIEARPGSGARLAISLPTQPSALASEQVDLPKQSAASAD